MGWIKRRIWEHTCNKPSYDYNMKAGDIWECDHCKRQYKIRDIEFEDRPAGAIHVHWDIYFAPVSTDPRDYRGYWRDI